jgi:hypothetical protein
MDRQVTDPAEEIKRLQRCINDLVSVLALPAAWSGNEPSRIVPSLLDALLRLLRLDLVYVRLKDPVGDGPIEMVRVDQSLKSVRPPEEICHAVGHWFGDDPLTWPAVVRKPIADREISLVPLRLGLDTELGFIVSAAQRPDFPNDTERLVLTVAANQAAIGLHEARLLTQQRRLARELDERVVQRARELAEAHAQVARSEEFLAQAQHLSRIGSYSWSLATDEITWSDELFRIYELDPPLTPARFRTRVHPEDLTLY